MRYRVQVHVYVNEYSPGLDQVNSYTNVLSHTEQTDVEADSYAAAGAQFDRITVGIREVLHGNGD